MIKHQKEINKAKELFKLLRKKYPLKCLHLKIELDINYNYIYKTKMLYKMYIESSDINTKIRNNSWSDDYTNINHLIKRCIKLKLINKNEIELYKKTID